MSEYKDRFGVAVRIEMHTGEPGVARWRALVDVKRPDAESDDVYGGYGSSPLEAVTELAKALGKVVGYERFHGHELERV